MRARLTIERAVLMVFVAALALSVGSACLPCYIPAPPGYGVTRPEPEEVILQCRALLLNATHRNCEARCQLRAVPVPAEGFEIDYSDIDEDACICEAPPKPEPAANRYRDSARRAAELTNGEYTTDDGCNTCTCLGTACSCTLMSCDAAGGIVFDDGMNSLEPELTPAVSSPSCAWRCTEPRNACLDACAQLGAQPGYCEKTCGAIYARCKKRCARAARAE